MSWKLRMILGIAAMLSLTFVLRVQADDDCTNRCSQSSKCCPASVCSQDSQKSCCPSTSSECTTTETCTGQDGFSKCQAACSDEGKTCVEVETQAPESFLSLLAKLLNGKAKGEVSIGVSLRLSEPAVAETSVPCVAKADQYFLNARVTERDSNCPGDPGTCMEHEDCAGVSTMLDDSVTMASVVQTATPPVPYPVAPTSASAIHFDSALRCFDQSSSETEGRLVEYMARVAALEARVEMLQQMSEMQSAHFQEMMELAIENAKLSERLALLEKQRSTEEQTTVASSEPKVVRVPAKAANHSIPQVGKCLDAVQVTEASCTTTTECPTVPEVQLSSSGITVLFPTSFQLPQKMRIDTGTLLEQVIRAVDARDATKANDK